MRKPSDVRVGSRIAMSSGRAGAPAVGVLDRPRLGLGEDPGDRVGHGRGLELAQRAGAEPLVLGVRAAEQLHPVPGRIRGPVCGQRLVPRLLPRPLLGHEAAEDLVHPRDEGRHRAEVGGEPHRLGR